MVAGIGTDVGKTIVSAILAILLQGDYWKPIQCGDEESSDQAQLMKWLDPLQHTVHQPAYSLPHKLSPHHAARLERMTIESEELRIPQTDRSLIIEGVGGVLVPLTSTISSLDLFCSWDCQWVVVSNHYLGSINHTLLTIRELRRRCIPLLGLIFNGVPNSDSESVILEISQLPCLGRLLPEVELNRQTFKRYVEQWRQSFAKVIP